MVPKFLREGYMMLRRGFCGTSTARAGQRSGKGRQKGPRGVRCNYSHASMQIRASTSATGTGSGTGTADVKIDKQAIVKTTITLEYILMIMQGTLGRGVKCRRSCEA